MFDISHTSIPGGVVIAGIAWAATSALVLGPMVLERELARDGWQSQCEASLTRQVRATQTGSRQNAPDTKTI